MHTDRADEAWRTDELVKTFLSGIRGGIPLAEVQIDVMLRLMGAVTGPLKSILDIGAGDGVLARAALLRFPEAHATLVDFSDPMIDAAEKNFADLSGRVRIRKADYSTPGWIDALITPFDAVISGFSIHHQPEARKKALYKEIRTLLRPGGIFINIDHCASRTGRDKTLADQYFIDSLKDYHSSQNTMESYEAVAERFHDGRKREAHVLSTVEDQLNWLKDAGFENPECYLKIFELALFAALRPAG